MTNFSTNQVMQFYALEGVTAEVKPYELENATVVTFTKGDESRVSDKLQNVMWGKLTTADALKKVGKKVTITTDKVVKGQDYVVRVSYPEVGGLGVEGWTTKVAVAHAKTTAATDIYKEIVLGYDSVVKLSEDESKAVPYVLLSNQLIATAWFAEQEKYKDFYEVNIKMTRWIVNNFDKLKF